jgi:hydroxyacylglutathione hydrolase
MKVHIFINSFFNSNTYIIEFENNKDCVVIDPVLPIGKTMNFVNNNNLDLRGVFITHEHADHCSGLNQLSEFYKFDLYCTTKCSENIANSKQNLSLYIEEIDAFEVNMPAKIVKDGDIVSFGTQSFTFIETQGHSPGSVCVFVNNMVFTGDTLLNETKTPLNFPHSNREIYKKSVKKLKKYLKKGMVVYPGHGAKFEL